MPSKFVLALLPLFAIVLAAKAQETPLLDYRDEAFAAGRAFYSEPERRAVAEALGAAPGDLASEMGEDFAILGDAEGGFTAPEARERAYLVQEAAPVAIEPFPDASAPVIVVLRDDASPAFFRLPPDVQYQRLVAAADATGDGRSEVLLESAFMNMGQSETTIAVVELEEDGTAGVVERIEAAHDGCANPVGEKSRMAATLVSGPQGLRVEKHELACPR